MCNATREGGAGTDKHTHPIRAKLTHAAFDGSEELPLSPPALAILERQPRRTGRDLIFGHGPGPFSGWSDCKARLDASINVQRGKPMLPWTLHDLRRTAATGMADLGVLPHVIEAVLNHISGHKDGVAGIYNRSTYAGPMRDALDRWATHLASQASA